MRICPLELSVWVNVSVILYVIQRDEAEDVYVLDSLVKSKTERLFQAGSLRNQITAWNALTQGFDSARVQVAKIELF